MKFQQNAAEHRRYLQLIPNTTPFEKHMFLFFLSPFSLEPSTSNAAILYHLQGDHVFLAGNCEVRICLHNGIPQEWTGGKPEFTRY